MTYIVAVKESMMYDGTNGHYIVDTWLDGAVTFVSDNGISFVFIDGNEQEITMSVGDYLLRSPYSYAFPWYTPAQEYADIWHELS